MARNRGRASVHDEFLLLAAAAVDGRIDADSAAALKAHLAACEACRAAQAAMYSDHLWLADPAAALPPSAEVRERLLDAARSPRVPRTSDAARSPWPALAAASVVVAVALAGFALATRRGPIVGGPAGGSSTVGPVPTTSAVAATSTATPLPLSTAVTAGPCVMRPPSLAAWWPGNDARDAIGGRVVTLRGGATFKPGLVGDALTLNGTDGYGEVAQDSTLLLGTHDFTVLLWVRFRSVDGEQVLMEQWQDTGGGAPATAGWTLTKLEDQVLLFTSERDGMGQGASTPPLDLRPDVWYHVAVRRVGGEVVLFVDGIPLGRGAAATALDIEFAAPLLLGRRGDDRGFLLDGQLDEVQLVLGRGLFETEVRAGYVAGSTGTCPQ